jgi:choline dehydrogenase-like flavoprotein
MPCVTLRYERAKLYEEVWAEAVTTVAKRYGISDVALRKICKQLAVPLPPLGYWAKVGAGKKPPTPPLPKYSGPEEIVRQRYVSDVPVEPDPEHLVARREFEARPENRIVVSETLDAPHPLVAATERAFRKPKQRDLRNLRTTERWALDISVSEASLPRALRIMDTLVKALDARGMPVRLRF